MTPRLLHGLALCALLLPLAGAAGQPVGSTLTPSLIPSDDVETRDVCYGRCVARATASDCAASSLAGVTTHGLCHSVVATIWSSEEVSHNMYRVYMDLRMSATSSGPLVAASGSASAIDPAGSMSCGWLAPSAGCSLGSTVAVTPLTSVPAGSCAQIEAYPFSGQASDTFTTVHVANFVPGLLFCGY